ncbi:uncharacterized protein LAESUDRAFT_754084 [Laetiporus sulphureus 93-53]|uniref:RING-type domain-containing protein n=1 Tax=Laetiporus sulphureus 93-53 TaxID=1314785 RepID=A0A165IH60_9APHY|nr:uncharacterized protein LAESUDRAFT_754084 [Laetiporus sulphureus 93-53]KZT13066.1 hypothetical protein LAESUDRAFT_754084 [Laetiporus sulphureus 93-53]
MEDSFDVHGRALAAILQLPVLNRDEIPIEDSCPICLNSLGDICSGSIQNEGTYQEYHAEAAQEIPLSGVTKLVGCGHMFCRVDLIEWIRCLHGTCPTCRHQFANIRPVSESDNESSDGDYMPNEDEEEEDEDDGNITIDVDEDDFEAFEMDMSFMDTDEDETEDSAETGSDDAESAHTAGSSRTRSEEVPISRLVRRNVTDFVDRDAFERMQNPAPPQDPAPLQPMATINGRFHLNTAIRTALDFASRISIPTIEWVSNEEEDEGDDEGGEEEDTDVSMENWGLSDGDGSESISDGSMFVLGDDRSFGLDNADIAEVVDLFRIDDEEDVTEEQK